MILEWLVKPGLIVDVGARGRERSNSFDLLSRFGWKGLLVEANPALYDEIMRDFSGTDYRLVRCAVAEVEGILPFYIGANDDVSSLLRDAASGWGDLRGQVDVHVRRLGAILDEHWIPHRFDILSLDIEGLDVEVFNDLIDNTPYRPKLVIMEASYDFKTKDLNDVGSSKAVQDAYEICGQTRANLFLSRKNDFGGLF
ncbi:conserved hypothetical protein [Sphingobium sp. SYK-6]|nr:conserved hypothetical protein [Sphingobium sp. SYK-6]